MLSSRGSRVKDQRRTAFSEKDTIKNFVSGWDAAIPYDALAIYILEQPEQTLKPILIHSSKKNRKSSLENSLSAGEKVVIESICKGKPTLARLSGVAAEISRARKQITPAHGFMIFPLPGKDSVKSCMVVMRRAGYFTGEEFKKAKGLTQQAWLTIQNIVMIHQIRQKEETIQAIQELLVQTQHSLNVSEFKAEKSMNVRHDFLSKMNHELRTPINGVLGLSQVLLSQPQSNENIEYLQAIKKSGEQLLAIVNSILEASEIETGALTLEEISFNPKELIHSVEQKLSGKASEKDLPLKVSIKNIPTKVIGDPMRLYHILFHLISNAIKFTERGHIALTSDVLRNEDDVVWLKFTVSDTGAGIPEERLHTIFDSFYQPGLTPLTPAHGVGLGLALVKKLTAIQNGTVTVKSKSGKGSTFTVVIPYKIHALPSSNGHRNSLKGLAPFENVKILLAEDNLVNQVVAMRTLEKWNIHVTLATNGREALEKLRQQSFDIVIMDIQMPEMDGLEAASRIRESFPEPIRNIPIMAMTACMMPDSVDRFKKVGINDQLEKPFHPQELYRKISKLLAIKR